MEKQKFENGMEFEHNGWCKILKRWTKNGHDRVYVNRENGKSEGYIDLISKENCITNKCPGWEEYGEAILALDFG